MYFVQLATMTRPHFREDRPGAHSDIVLIVEPGEQPGQQVPPSSSFGNAVPDRARDSGTRKMFRKMCQKKISTANGLAHIEETTLALAVKSATPVAVRDRYKPVLQLRSILKTTMFSSNHH